MVGQHEATDSVCRLDVRRLPRQCNLDGNSNTNLTGYHTSRCHRMLAEVLILRKMFEHAWYLELPPMFIPSLHVSHLR